MAHQEPLRGPVFTLRLLGGLDRSDSRLAKALQSANRALRLRADLSVAHHALGYYHYVSARNYEAALREYTAALRGQPNDADLLFSVAALQRRSGDSEYSIESWKKVAELDPRNGQVQHELGNGSLRLRRYPEAETHLRRAVSLGPDYFGPYLRLACLYVAWQGDSTRAGSVLQEAWTQIDARPLFSGNESWSWWVYRTLSRDYGETLERFSVGSFGTDTASYLLARAELYELLDDPPRSRADYDTVRVILESVVRLQPDEARYHAELGLAYAGLGLREDAIREGRLAVDVLPLSKDAYDGADWATYLALIYTKIGEYDEAIDQLDYVLSVPAFISVNWLRIDPAWDPLRDHPRFQALLAKYE